MPCAPVLALDEIHLDPQIEASKTLEVVDHPVMGAVRQPRPAPLVNGQRSAPGAPAPVVGAHTREVLAENGFDDKDIETLLEDGVVATTS